MKAKIEVHPNGLSGSLMGKLHNTQGITVHVVISLFPRPAKQIAVVFLILLTRPFQKKTGKHNKIYGISSSLNRFKSLQIPVNASAHGVALPYQP